MNRVLFLLAVALSACQPNDVLLPQPDGTPSSQQPAEATAVGKPLGPAVQQTIGPAGGTLTLPVSGTLGQSLTLDVPAGALTTATAITARLVENTAPGGIGPALDFSPKTVTFSKPVGIRWQHGPNGLNGTGPAAVGLAYQQADGRWVGKANLTPNDAQKTLTATRPGFDLKYPVAFYQNFYLRYGSNTLAPSERLELIVAYQPNHSDAAENADRETLLASLRPFKPVGAENLKNWRLNGSDPTSAYKAWGTLNVHENGGKALYIAPDRVPAANPAAISVDLKTGGQSRIILVANIQVVGGNSLTAGKTYANPKIGASISQSSAGTTLFVSLQEVNPAEVGYAASASFQIKNFMGPGTYTIDKTFNDPKVTIQGKQSGKDGLLYVYGYNKGSESVFSSGSVTITEYTGPKGKLSGSFSAGLYNYDKAKNSVKTESFGGTFRVSL